MFIGLDLGTSSLKAILMDEAHAVVAEHTVPLSVQRPADGWSEQDPATWCEAAMTALRALAQQTDCSGVIGLGLSGHMHGATLVGADDVPLRLGDGAAIETARRSTSKLLLFDVVAAVVLLLLYDDVSLMLLLMVMNNDKL